MRHSLGTRSKQCPALFTPIYDLTGADGILFELQCVMYPVAYNYSEANHPQSTDLCRLRMRQTHDVVVVTPASHSKYLSLTVRKGTS
jgi:hypothetical protein